MKAVVFVDVQTDFIDGALKNDKAIEVTPKIVEFAKECVKNGYKLYATRDTHEKTKYEQHAEFKRPVFKDTLVPVGGYLTTLEGQKLPVEHCVEGTDGWMIDNRLMEAIDGSCTFINKQTFGSIDLAEVMNEDFFDTYQYIESYHCNIKCCAKEEEPLEEIIVCGFCTDICVISNAILLRAKFPNIKITVMKDLCVGTTDEKHEAALKSMESCQIDVAVAQQRLIDIEIS